MVKKRDLVAGKVGYTILILVLILLVFGVVMVYDASVVYAHETFGGKYRLLVLQVVWVIIGLFFLCLTSLLDYRYWARFAGALLVVCLFFLFLLAWPHLPLLKFFYPRFFYEEVRFFPLVYGAYRWVVVNPAPLPELPLLGRFSFQPTELAKLAVVLYFSSMLASRKKAFRRGGCPWYKNLLLPFLVRLGVVIFLTALQPDLGTAVVLATIAVGSYFAAGVPLRQILFIFCLFLVFSFSFIALSPYRRQRLMTFLDPSSSGKLSSGYHIEQVMIALGSGGVAGLGLGQSRQKYEYLPEVTTDSIFAVVGEEMGFLGASLLISLFLFLLYLGFKISRQAKDELGKLVSFGVATWLGIQAVINLAAMTKLLPLTGVPLPLVSYGGSSMVLTLAALGILLNISRQAGRR